MFSYETEHSAPVIMETVRNAYVNILLRWEVLEALIYELKELHWSDLFDSVENFWNFERARKISNIITFGFRDWCHI